MEKSDTIKIIVQFLNEKGYKEVGDKLEQESNISAESKNLKNLKNYISKGKYEKAISIILNNANEKEQIYLIPKIRVAQIFDSILQNFDEDKSKNITNQNETIQLIRKIISSNEIYDKDATIQKCMKLVFINNHEELTKKMKEISPVSFSKESLNDFIESTLSNSNSLLKSLHPKSLEHMLDSLVKNQINKCLFHTVNNKAKDYSYSPFKINPEKFSYFEDHKCLSTNIPYKCLLTIEEYDEEILNLMLSPNEKYVAVILKSNLISIYKLTWIENLSSMEITVISSFKAHENQITSLQWNKNETMILTASKDKTVKLFDIFTGQKKISIELSSMASSAIFYDNESKILTSCLSQKLGLYTIEGILLEQTPTVTVNEILFSEKFNLIILIAPTIKAVILYDYPTKSEYAKLMINDTIVSTSLSKLDQGRYLLVNSSNATPVISMWDLSTRSVERKFFGHRQERLSTKCTFGGEHEKFILSGSDNKEFYIWNRNSTIPISVIKAHSSCVNAAIWPMIRPNSFIILSASDDHTLKIFGNDKVNKIFSSKDRKLSTENLPDEVESKKSRSRSMSMSYSLDNCD
jgi:WD40 repeat protein